MEFTKSTSSPDFASETGSVTIRSIDNLGFVFVEQKKKLSSVKAYVDFSDFNQNYEDQLKKRDSYSSNQLQNDVILVDMSRNGSPVFSEEFDNCEGSGSLGSAESLKEEEEEEQWTSIEEIRRAPE